MNLSIAMNLCFHSSRAPTHRGAEDAGVCTRACRRCRSPDRSQLTPGSGPPCGVGRRESARSWRPRAGDRSQVCAASPAYHRCTTLISPTAIMLQAPSPIHVRRSPANVGQNVPRDAGALQTLVRRLLRGAGQEPSSPSSRPANENPGDRGRPRAKAVGEVSERRAGRRFPARSGAERPPSRPDDRRWRAGVRAVRRCAARDR